MSRPAARYAVCERVLRQGSFGDDVALTVAAGIAGLGVDAAAVDTIGVDEAVRILEGEGVRVSSYMTLPDILPGNGAAPLTDTARRLDDAARLGAPTALVATGPLGSLAPADADAECRTWLAAAGALAAERDVRIVVEPMHPLMRRWSYVHTLGHACRLVDGLPGTGVVLDLGHVWWEDGLDALIRTGAGAIASVQVTNVDATALDDLRYERAPLEHGAVPVASLVDLLESSGYGGWYENEVLVRMPRDQRLDMLRSSRAWFEAR
jgi:sugar phosphate isomerase/epimerase